MLHAPHQAQQQGDGVVGQQGAIRHLLVLPQPCLQGLWVGCTRYTRWPRYARLTILLAFPAPPQPHEACSEQVLASFRAHPTLCSSQPHLGSLGARQEAALHPEDDEWNEAHDAKGRLQEAANELWQGRAANRTSWANRMGKIVSHLVMHHSSMLTTRRPVVDLSCCCDELKSGRMTAIDQTESGTGPSGGAPGRSGRRRRSGEQRCQ